MKILLKPLDYLLNSLTMYQLVQWGLRSLTGVAVLITFLGLLPFSPWWMIASFSVLVCTCMGANLVLSKLFKAPTNIESSAITGLILFFLFSPPSKPTDLLTLVLVSLIAMSSKYFLAIKHRHLFNPAALGAVVMGFAAYIGR